MRRRVRPLTWGAVWVLLATTALAVAHRTLYVKARNTQLLASSKPGAKVLKTLELGEQVEWQGPDAQDKRFQKVSAGSDEGVVFITSLSTKPPQPEVQYSDGPSSVSQSDFVSSGAATKGFSESALTYGTSKGDAQKTLLQLRTAEEISRDVTAAQVSEHVKKTGLNPVVGKDAAGSGSAAGGAR